MQKKQYIKVNCKDCGVSWNKVSYSVKNWGGRCKSCSSKELASRDEMKEVMRRNGLMIISKYGKIPNCNKGKLSGEESPSWKGGKPKCVDCGVGISYNKKRCVKCSGKQKLGISRTQEYKEKLRSIIPRGNKHWNWNNGSSGENILVRMSGKYKDWRKAVFERDNYTCQDCGLRNVEGLKLKLNADHIKPFALHPELRFDISNGRTLCECCHKKTDTFGWKLSNRIIANN